MQTDGIPLIRMAFPTRIYLTGFMGSGKTTIGPLLARRLGYDYFDLDEAIESVAGKTVQEIFVVDGEEAFRRLEALKLRAVSRRAREVISMGGGAVTSGDNLYFAKTNGAVIYLRVEPTVLAERLRESAVRRPLLQDAQGKPLEGGALLRRIEKMLEERERYYEQADITLDIGSHSIDEVVEMTLEALKRHAERSH